MLHTSSVNVAGVIVCVMTFPSKTRCVCAAAVVLLKLVKKLLIKFPIAFAFAVCFYCFADDLYLISFEML